MKTTLLVCMTALVLTAPAVAAVGVNAPVTNMNHGLYGLLVAQLADGTVATAVLEYVTGDGATQTWNFYWADSNGQVNTCEGFGNVEVGFVHQGCPVPFATAGTGDPHAYPNPVPDVHNIAVAYGGSGGSGDQIVFA